MREYFSCKDGVNVEDLYKMSPFLFKILGAVVLYCAENNLPCVITSILDEAQGRVSKTHEQGRAFDLSVREWPELHIHRLVHRFNKDFKDIGAISKRDGESRAVVYHKVEGSAYHMHFQVRKDLTKEI